MVRGKPARPRPEASGLRLEWLDPKDLLDNPSNWRRHPAAQEMALRDAMKEVGWAGALLYNERTKRLVDGHLRKKLADGPVPVLVGDWSEEQERLILATLDPIGAMAHSDQDALLGLLSQINTSSELIKAMMEALANNSYEPLMSMPPLYEVPEVPEPQIDKAEELRAKWGTQRGQIWEILGRMNKHHRLGCLDSQVDIDICLQGIEPQVVITDPPYGIGITKGLGTIGGAKAFGRVCQLGGKSAGILKGTVGRKGLVQPRLYHPIHGDDKPFEPSWLLPLAPTVIIFGANYFSSRLPDSAGWLVWDKEISDESDFSACELIFCNIGRHVRKYTWRWSGMIRNGDRDIELAERVHPTQKPVGLLEMIINDYSNNGDLILDPYLGSGSTIVACERTGRICYGMEIEPMYVAVTLERLKDMGLEPRLLEKA